MLRRSGVFGAILSVGVLFFVGCTNGSFGRVEGSGTSQTEIRKTDAFHAVRLNGAADVSITIGDKTEVTVTADDNVLPLIEIDASGGTLVIGNKESYSSHVGVKVAIVTPSLDAFELNGSGDVTINGLKGEKFSAKIRGSGDLTADGSVDSVDASIAGSGDLKLVDLKAKKVDVSIAGSGGATVSADESFTASIAGSGDISYKGNPANVQSNVAGSGRVHKI